MSSYDVRNNNSADITNIVFYEECGRDKDIVLASCIMKPDCYNDCVEVWGRTESVLIESAEHARNLQKALDKAIELGWLK